MNINNNMYIDDERNHALGKVAPSRKQKENYMSIVDVVVRESEVTDKNVQNNSLNVKKDKK